MSFWTVNGTAVVRGTMSRPRTGIWHADLVIDARETESARFQGAATVTVGDVSFQGTFLRVEPYMDALGVRIVGGAGGMGKVLPPRAYQNATVRLPLTEICTGAGEVLSPTSDASVLSRLLVKWIRVQQQAGAALASLLKAAGSPSWRILDDGTLWVGTEAWAPIDVALADLTDVDAGLGRVEIATDTPGLLKPGGTYNGRRLSYVEHRVKGWELRHVLWFEDAARV